MRADSSFQTQLALTTVLTSETFDGLNYPQPIESYGTARFSSVKSRNVNRELLILRSNIGTLQDAPPPDGFAGLTDPWVIGK